MKKRIGKLATRYAHALLNAVEREFGTLPAPEGRSTEGPSKAQEIATQLVEFADSLSAERELNVAILSPMFDRDQRKKALSAIAQAEGLPEILQGFLRLVFDRDRFALISEIAHAFRQLADSAAKVVLVEITTASQVTGEEVSAVERSLAQLIEGRARFVWIVDAEIIGGMVIRYAGKVVDGSIQGRLNRLERELMH